MVALLQEPVNHRIWCNCHPFHAKVENARMNAGLLIVRLRNDIRIDARINQ